MGLNLSYRRLIDSWVWDRFLSTGSSVFLRYPGNLEVDEAGRRVRYPVLVLLGDEGFSEITLDPDETNGLVDFRPPIRPTRNTS